MDSAMLPLNRYKNLLSVIFLIKVQSFVKLPRYIYTNFLWTDAFRSSLIAD